MTLPRWLYVSVKDTGSAAEEDEYYFATEDAEDHAELGEVVTVARYELKETGTVSAEPTFVAKKKR